jgi:hypothetical protein
MAYRYSVSYTLATRSNRMPWEIFLTDEANGWLDDLTTVDEESYRQVVYAIEALDLVRLQPVAQRDPAGCR